MHLIDWILVAVPLLLTLAVGIYTQRYMKSVTGFLSGGRVAGPYLLGLAKGELYFGAVVFVAYFELIGESGFTLTWWERLREPALLLIVTTGFVVYRFRETRALTLAQFFELRYSRGFRLLTGMLALVAGLADFGVIPSIGSRFIVHFLGLPPTLVLFAHSVPTYVPMMAGFLSVSLFVSLTGGLITVMVTNCIEGILSGLFYCVILVTLLVLFKWSQISAVLGAQPVGQSMFNPFDSLAHEDFNIWFLLIGVFLEIYSTMSWQNTSGYNSAAITPHASVMAGVLYRWRESGKMAVITLLAVCAMTFLKHPDFAVQAASANQEIAAIHEPQIQTQMRLPVATAHLLPMGVKGLLCVCLIMGVFGGDATHLHSWGSIFVQDVLVPLRRRPFAPKQHIRMLRFSIFGVAVFAFLFGSLFNQTEYVFIWWQIVSAIYVSGIGAVIIGGLYWKKGTNSAAWAAMIVGLVLTIAGLTARHIVGHGFFLTGPEVTLYSTLLSIITYVAVSLFTCRQNFDMDRMLHRGKYAQSAGSASTSEAITTLKPSKLKWSLSRLVGFDENYTRGDKWIAGGLFAWCMIWTAITAVGTIWNLISPWPASVWSQYWHITGIGLPVCIAGSTSIWFAWGGVRDIRRLFQRLKEQKISHLDDGTVSHHQNLDEAVNLPEVKKLTVD